MNAPLRFLFALLLAVATAMPAFAQLKDVPALTTRVTDQAGMLDASQRQRLEAVLAEYEQKTGSQIAVLLVKSTEPEPIEQYSIRVTDAWKLGRKGVDDGVLLLVARDNPSSLRRLRIEAGRGVQGVLTDAQSKRILQDTIAPHFRQNHYYEGLVAGVGAIATLLNQEAFPAPARVQPQQQPATPYAGLLTFLGIPLLGLIMLVSIMGLTIAKKRKITVRSHRSQSDWGNAAAGFILGSVLNSVGRSGGGGGFGGGGFSGGGGSFDGGGASGDW